MIAPNAKAAWDLMSVAKLVDGKYFLAGTQANSSNVFADIYSAGSSKFTSRQFQFDTGVNINLHKVLKGLSFETHFAVDYATSYNTSFDNSYAVYIPTWANVDGKDMIVALKKEGEDKSLATRTSVEVQITRPCFLWSVQLQQYFQQGSQSVGNVDSFWLPAVEVWTVS